MAFLLKILQGSERRSVERRARHYQREASRKKEDPVLYQVKQKLRRHPDPEYRNMSEEELLREARHLTDPNALKEFFSDITHAPIQKLLQEVSLRSGSRASGAVEPPQEGSEEKMELQRRRIDEVGHLTLKLHLNHSDETPSLLTKLGAALLKIPYGVLNAYLEIGDSNNKEFTYIVEFNSSSLVQPRRKRRIERTALEATIPLGGHKMRINQNATKGKSATLNPRQRKQSASHDLTYACQALVTPPRERRIEEQLPHNSSSSESESDSNFMPLRRPRTGCMRSSSMTSPIRRKKIKSACASPSSGIDTTTGASTTAGPTPSAASLTPSISIASSTLTDLAVPPSPITSVSVSAVTPPDSSTSPTPATATPSSAPAAAAMSAITSTSADDTSPSPILNLNTELLDSNTLPNTATSPVTSTSSGTAADSAVSPSTSTGSSAHAVPSTPVGSSTSVSIRTPTRAPEANFYHKHANGDTSAARSAPKHQLYPSSKIATKEESQNSKHYSSLDNNPLLEEFRNSMVLYSQTSGEDLTDYVQLSLSKIILIDKLVNIIVQYNKRYYYHSITRNCQTFVIDVLQSFGVWENFRFGDKLEEYLENLNKGRKEVYKSHKSVNDRVKYLIVSGELNEITYDEARYLRSLYTIFHLEEAAIAPPTSGQAVCSDPDCLLMELEKKISEMRPEGAMIPKMPEDYLQ